MTARSFAAEGIILKRTNVGEADRVIVILTREFGKISCIAKGVRKLTSRKRGALEPGNQVKLYMVEGRGMKMLTQAIPIQEFLKTDSTLKDIRSLLQALEIFDAVFVEEQDQEEEYGLAIQILTILQKRPAAWRKKIEMLFVQLLQRLGFLEEQEEQKRSITSMVESLINRKMRSFTFLTLPGNA